MSPTRPRAVGRRIDFGQVPARVHDWVSERFGPVTVVAEHSGGMSPGCATTLAMSSWERIFIKAVVPS